MRFTGVAAATPASMTAAWLTDNRRARPRSTTTPSSCAAPASTAAKLPPLVPTGSVVGAVLPEVAAELGLPAGSHPTW